MEARAWRLRARVLVGLLKRVPGVGWLSACFLVFGVAQLVPGGAAVLQSVELSRHGLHADGVVEAVRYHESTYCYDGNCNDWTEVTVVFVDAHGVAHRVSRAGVRDSRVGDRVHVTYAPSDPERLRWNGSRDLRYGWLFNGTVCVIAGVGFGIDEWVKARRRRNAHVQLEGGPVDG